MSLEKRVDCVMIIKMILINCLGISVASAWAAMFAYSFVDVKMSMVVWLWL